MTAKFAFSRLAFSGQQGAPSPFALEESFSSNSLVNCFRRPMYMKQLHHRKRSLSQTPSPARSGRLIPVFKDLTGTVYLAGRRVGAGAKLPRFKSKLCYSLAEWDWTLF